MVIQLAWLCQKNKVWSGQRGDAGQTERLEVLEFAGKQQARVLSQRGCRPIDQARS